MGPPVRTRASEEEKMEKFLTSPLPSPPITQGAARTQRSPAVDAGTAAVPVPDHDADFEPPPNETAESPSTHQPPN